MNKWELVSPRSKIFNSQMYVAGIIEIGEEKREVKPSVFLYSNSVAFLNQIVEEHNKLLEMLEKDKKIK